MDERNVRLEIERIEQELAGRISAIQQDAVQRIVAEINAVQPVLAPLMLYLSTAQAMTPGQDAGRARRPKKGSAEGLLLRSLAKASEGMDRSDLDNMIISAGLSIASARKARYNAESNGWVVRAGQQWSITAAGREEAFRR